MYSTLSFINKAGLDLFNEESDWIFQICEYRKNMQFDFCVTILNSKNSNDSSNCRSVLYSLYTEQFQLLNVSWSSYELLPSGSSTTFRLH